MNEEEKEAIVFLLKSIEKLTMATLVGDYDVTEFHIMLQESQQLLFTLTSDE